MPGVQSTPHWTNTCFCVKTAAAISLLVPFRRSSGFVCAGVNVACRQPLQIMGGSSSRVQILGTEGPEGSWQDVPGGVWWGDITKMNEAVAQQRDHEINEISVEPTIDFLGYMLLFRGVIKNIYLWHGSIPQPSNSGKQKKKDLICFWPHYECHLCLYSNKIYSNNNVYIYIHIFISYNMFDYEYI